MRCFLARRRYAERAEYVGAVVKIQRLYRAYCSNLTDTIMKLALERRTKAVTDIQRVRFTCCGFAGHASINRLSLLCALLLPS